MNIHISHIGNFAHQVLEHSKGAHVSGIASRGLYLQPEDDWTLYLSREVFRGPLTLNLEGDLSWLENIKTSSPALFKSGAIHLPEEKISISIENSEVWRPAPDDGGREFFPGQLESVLNISKKLASENPYLALLSDNPVPFPDVPWLSEKILSMQNGLKDGNLEKITDGTSKLLGLGPGLTPLGDDFLLGVLLVLNRLGDLRSPDPSLNFEGDSASRPYSDIHEFNKAILDSAREKTTRLSISLLACAAEGAADERLLKVLDGFFTEDEILEGDIKNLLAWGSSSGIAVLAGMMAALS